MNSITDCPGLLCSVLLVQPLVWVIIALGIVTAFVAVTERHDIGRDSAGAIRVRNSNPVIHRQGVEESRRATANGTTAVKVVKGKLPIFFEKVARKSALSGQIVMEHGVEFRPVVFGPLAAGSLLSFWIHLLPLPSLLGMTWIVALVYTLPFPLSLYVATSPAPTAIPPLFAVILCPLAGILSPLFRVSSSINTIGMARFTSPAKAWGIVTVVNVKILRSCREFVAANCTALKGCGRIVLHKKMSFLVSIPGLFAQCRDNLFTPLILPQNGGAS
jgi:hypothetical protein